LQFIFRKSRDDKLRREQQQVKYGVFISENTRCGSTTTVRGKPGWRDFRKDNTVVRF
jgi:hypothetical protein